MTSNSHIDPTQPLYDIYDTIHVPWWQHPWFYTGVGCSFLLMISLAAWYILKKIRAKKRIITPWDAALEELDRLHKEGFVSVVYSKELYTALTRLLKKYVQERYGFDIIGKTDEEVIAFLETHYFPEDLLSSMRAIFSGSVIIKFSNAYAIKAQIEQDFAASRTIIYKTIPPVK